MAFRLIDESSPAGAVYVLGPGENLVGSSPTCDVFIEDPSVSRQHAVLVVARDRVEIADLGSANGTLVNEARVRGKAAVQPGDELAFGSRAFTFRAIGDDDIDLAIRLDTEGQSTPEAAAIPAASTASLAPLHRFTAEHLGDILQVLDDDDRTAHAAIVGDALARTLPTIRVEILSLEGSREALLFSTRNASGEGIPLRLESWRTAIEVEMPHQGAMRLHRPLIEIALQLLELGLRTVTDNPRPRTHPSDPSDPEDLWPLPRTLHPGLAAIYREAAIVARGRIPVLILGETGTGKELLARFLHTTSAVAEGPFVTLNCAAIPRDLQEAELFGIEKGVATGVTARAGKFELAHGGTLFLDEIGDMDPGTQAKILRVLQEGEVHRLGSATARPARFRLVSATHRDLEGMREDGSFRQDLYHRISDWQVVIPTLRERRIDIVNLAAYFLSGEARQQDKRITGISRRAARILESYSWPGNVRELEREIARASLFVPDGGLLESESLSARIRTEASPEALTLERLLEQTEKKALREAWERSGGDVHQVSRELDVPTSTIYRKMKKYRLRES